MNQAEIFLPGFAIFLKGNLQASLQQFSDAAIRAIRIE
jgi:hypothetical protein